MWTPGYWGYSPGGYYWVPGVWVVPPYYGGLWTPGYWGWYGGRYRWHPGYWGLHVGFYGGVNYGFGYIGTGYFGGYWHGNAFVYNRAVTHVGGNVGFDHVYNRTVVYNGRTFGPRPASRISYNGGRGGIQVAPRPGEYTAMHETHTAALPGQVRLHQNAAANPQAAFNANRGHVAGNLAARQAPLDANRPIANTQREFQPRAQNQPRSQQQYRPNPQPRQQSRPAPRPESHSASHDDKH
ncbi:BcpO-related WXXGXW repeat protein [Granulicella sp. 5B5]|nr:BcpO-related WXXGXW repeat protein [Granulicella sp. 5B5]